MAAQETLDSTKVQGGNRLVNDLNALKFKFKLPATTILQDFPSAQFILRTYCHAP